MARCVRNPPLADGDPDLGHLARPSLHAATAGRGRQPKYLFSGLLKCGVCGANYAIADSYRYGCSANVNKGPTARTPETALPVFYRTSPAAENEAFERIFERRFTCQLYSANLSILTVSARHTSE